MAHKAQASDAELYEFTRHLAAEGMRAQSTSTARGAIVGLYAAASVLAAGLRATIVDAGEAELLPGIDEAVARVLIRWREETPSAMEVPRG